MVRALAAFLSFAAAVSAPVVSTSAAPAYRVAPASIALGEPLSVSITARADLLDNLDLAPLMRDFEVRDRNQGGDGRESSLSLTLYPLRTGRIALPNLGLPLRAPSVTVLEHSDTVPRVRFSVETAPARIHVREPVRLTVEACDDGSLMWQRPQLVTQEGLLLRPLNEEQFDAEREGERCTAHRWHWQAVPTAPGQTVLPLPMLQASKFGAQLRFPPPPAALHALPVPNWLPQDAAIGQPEISAAPLPHAWPLERPLAWRIEVSGGYSAEALRNLLQLQLAGLPAFADYAPLVELLASDGAAPRFAVTLYAVLRERGDMQLPELVFPWYDPAGAQLRQAKVKGAAIAVVDPARQRLFVWLKASSAALAAFALGYFLWRTLAWRVRRQRALAELKRVADLAGLIRWLCAFSLKSRALPAATLGEWLRRMRQELRCEGLAELAAAVEAAHYGRAETQLAVLRERALACLAAAQPLRSGLRP